jgi:excisionase family DNA binding protein
LEAKEYYTIKEAAELTTFSPNTIRKWTKQGLLKSEKVEGPFGSEYRIRAHDLYHSGIDKINRRLGPDMVGVRRAEAEANALASSEKYLEELARLSRELVEARTELGILRFQVPALEAAQVEGTN